MTAADSVRAHGAWNAYALPVIGFVGVSGSGKTTLLERVIAELTLRGWRVGTAKHHHRPDFEMDVPGKDSWRHAQAGAVLSMISSEEKLGAVWKVERERTVEELAALAAGPADILITESIRDPHSPQIEVVRTAHSDRITCPPENLFALVTDGSFPVGETPVFALDDVEGVCDLIETVLLARAAARDGDARRPDTTMPGGSNRV